MGVRCGVTAATATNVALGPLGISSVLQAGLNAEEEPGVWAKNEPIDPVLSEAMSSGFVKTGPSIDSQNESPGISGIAFSSPCLGTITTAAISSIGSD
jgi:hypothetical protein